MKRFLAFCVMGLGLGSYQNNTAPQSSPAEKGDLLHVSGAGRSVSTLLECKFPDATKSIAPTVVSDLADGLSSDGRGPYIHGTDDVVESAVSAAATLTIFHAKTSTAKSSRTYAVNLSNPVRGGGGLPLGIITDSSGSGIGLMTQWSMVGDAFNNLHSIQVGQSFPAAMMSVAFRIDGRFHILQMGPLPNGHCYTTRVHGAGTTPATVSRPTQTKWSVDLPAGSIGRLFDIADGTERAVDKGLYYFRLHYEIGN